MVLGLRSSERREREKGGERGLEGAYLSILLQI
jgi:hypothetical protein